MVPRQARALLSLSVSLSLCGCGLTIPNISEAWDVDRPANPDKDQPRISATAQIEFEIKKQVYCELKRAIHYVNSIPVSSGTPGKLRPVSGGVLPLKWGAQVSLSLQVDESAALNPGVTLNQPMANAVSVFGPGNTVTSSQSFNLGLGGALSSTATRIDKFNPYWSIAYLMEPFSPASVCQTGNDPFEQLHWRPAASSPFLRFESDLGIRDWLEGAMFTDVSLYSVDGPAAGSGLKPDTVSYEIKFIIVSSGNVTPTWKLLRVSANTAGNFFSTGRTRTHDLIITIGPKDQTTIQAHFASEIGQAVSSANRSALIPQ